jgi:hypothetical protein
MSTSKKLRLPNHDYLGYYYGTNKTEVREIINKKYSIPKGARIIVNDSNDRHVFEVEILREKK